jgi:DNA repair exonuclease SbcCD ATPase subunit
MNQTQINQIQGQVDRYFQLDMTSLLNASFPELNENEVCIGQYTLKEFLSLSNKVFNQFREELKTSFLKSLPFQYQFHNEFGGADLNSDLSSFVSYSESNRFPNAVSHLARLIHYQAVNGFWEKSKRKYFRHSEENLNAERERIELVSKQLESSVNIYVEHLASLDATKDDLTRFTHAKQKELSEIESLLGASRNHSTEITELHSSTTSLSERIQALLDGADAKKEEIDGLNKEAKDELKKIALTLEDQTEVIEKQNALFDSLESSFDKKLEFVNSKTSHFEERNRYLDDLIGREVGASLFEAFKQRKGELSSSITFWTWSVPITAIATIVWIFVLFGNGDLNSLGWQVVFVNSLKALPAIGILLFSISQYTKERNFQEEYAFKSAVALTVNSYADQLQKDENKDQLIMDSVNAIYKTPLHTKAVKETDRKSLAESARELKNVVSSLMAKK